MTVATLEPARTRPHRSLTSRQRAYLRAFDRVLRAGTRETQTEARARADQKLAAVLAEAGIVRTGSPHYRPNARRGG